MNATPILPEDDPASFPSMPTLHGGDPNTLGRIDHYDLLRKLGGGGFGVVYLARDSVSGIEVALKTLHPLLKTNAEEMDALREKFRLVHGLTHPNIAKALVLHPVRDVNIWDETARKEMRLSPGDSVMVMDYAPGVTLSKWRRQFPDGIVPPDLVLKIGRQLASALDYAHGERIVHRDIKPGNIMVETLRADEPREASDHEVEKQDTSKDGGASRPGEQQLFTVHSSPFTPNLRVRLLDFGLAAEIRSSMSRVSTETGDTSGTRPYMAPEQWLGKKQDGRTDQYALACVLYEQLSGAPPFAGVFETGDPIIMRTAVERDAPEEIEDAPPAINAALRRALSKAPKDRFPTCAAFIGALSPETRKPNIPGNPNPEAGGASSPSAPPRGAPPPFLRGDAPQGQAVVSHAESEKAAEAGRARSPSAPANTANSALEADVVRRKVSLTRAFSSISEGTRMDSGCLPMVSEMDMALTAAENAFKFGRFTAADQCLSRAEAALARLRKAMAVREAASRNEARIRRILVGFFLCILAGFVGVHFIPSRAPARPAMVTRPLPEAPPSSSRLDTRFASRGD